MEIYELLYRIVPFRHTNSINYDYIIEIPETYDSYTRKINFIKSNIEYYRKCLIIAYIGLKEKLPKEILKIIIFFWLESENSEKAFEIIEQHEAYNKIADLYDFEHSFDDIK